MSALLLLAVAVGGAGVVWQWREAVANYDQMEAEYDRADAGEKEAEKRRKEAEGQRSLAEERERAARELADARDRAVSASQHKSDFLATMSHEIRTPLNGIIGLNELLGATTLSDRQQHLASGIAVSSRSLLDLINDILDFSKIEARKLSLEPVVFHLRDAIGDTVRALAVRAQQKGVELVCDICRDVPEYVVGDPGRLRQVLVNLVGNAIKFTHEGEVEVRVSLSDDKVTRWQGDKETEEAPVTLSPCHFCAPRDL